MWDLYDDLIAAVPDNLEVQDCLAGLSWFLVKSIGVGVSMRPLERTGSIRNAGHLRGMKLRDLSAWAKSWDEYEAAMGIAAINSALNAPEIVGQRFGKQLSESNNQDVFTYLREEMRGKKVAVVGHFDGLERVAEICDLSVLERRPQDGDLPDVACEYILQDREIVIMTATTLINKTMPRLLALSQGARIVVAGPTTPLHPLMFNYGIEMLGGLLLQDEQNVWRIVAEGGQKQLFSAGSRMLNLERPRVNGTPES